MLYNLFVVVALMSGYPIAKISVRADFHYTDIKIVDGTDKISGSGHDSGIQYISPDPFTGPEYMASLNGLCFTASADRFEYSVCPFHNITQRRVTGGRPTLLGVWGDWESTNNGDIHRMLFFRGQACGQGTRKATVEVIPNSADDFRVDPDSIDESPACHFNLRFHVPFPSELLAFNVIQRKAVSEGRVGSSASGSGSAASPPQYVESVNSGSAGRMHNTGAPHGPSRLHNTVAAGAVAAGVGTSPSSASASVGPAEPTELLKSLSSALQEVRIYASVCEEFATR
jgi:hypothetical protein